MSNPVLKKLQNKYGDYHKDLQKENHDPMSLDHPDNQNDYLDIQCNYPQNGKQNKHKTQNTKTKDEWDSNQHIITQNSSNKITLTVNNEALIDQSFDEFELKKKKKPTKHYNSKKSNTHQNQYDIWLIISLQKTPIIHINLYNSSNVSIIPPNNAMIFIPQDFGKGSNLYVCDTETKSKVNKYLTNSDDDIFISIMHDTSEECIEFFKFIEYLHQKTPSDRDISYQYKTLVHNNKSAKKTPNYAALAKNNNRGYNPNIDISNGNNNKNKSVKHNKTTGNKRSRAQLMCQAGQSASNPAAARAAADRYNKSKKTPAATKIDTDLRRKLQIEHFKSKKQFKSANYPKSGKSSGDYMHRKGRNQRVYSSRTAKAKGGNKIAQNRINNIGNDCYPYNLGYMTEQYTYGSGPSSSILDSRYTSRRSGEQIGFKNLGNTCYINAILRSINSLNCLSNDFRRQYIFDISGNNIYGIHSVFRSYLELLFKDINNIKKEILDPWIFKKIIGKMDQMFASYSQQDAHELLSFLLNALHDQIFKGIGDHFENNNNNNNNNNNKIELKKEELEWLSPIHSNFHFEIEFEYECTLCGYKRNKIESFREMSLDLPLEKHAEKKDSEKKQDEIKQKQDENEPDIIMKTQDENQQKQEEKHEPDVIMKNNLNKSEKEEMSEDEKEEAKQEEIKVELTPFEKLKQELLKQYDDGCPLHKDKYLEFKDSPGNGWLRMLCSECNNALIGRIQNPDNISAPMKQIAPAAAAYPMNFSGGSSGGIGRDNNGNKINTWSLNELLRAYFVKKTLEYKCEHNGCVNNKVYVTSWFKQTPRVLVFHIKRFIPNYYTNSYTKSHDKVEIEKNIDINMFCNEKLSLPPDIFEDYNNDRHGAVNGDGNVMNNGNDIYDKIFENNNDINVLDICGEMKDLPKEMQNMLKKDDYKEKSDSKDDDDDIEILNNKNKNNNNNKEEKDEKCNENGENIPPKVNISSPMKVSGVSDGVKDININVGGDTDSKNSEIEVDNKSASDYMTQNELKLQEQTWNSFDPTWRIAWSKDRCEQVLRDEKSDMNVIEYAKMYYKHWKSVEYYEKHKPAEPEPGAGTDTDTGTGTGVDDSRKRKRSEDGSDGMSDGPKNKKQKMDGKQQKITDMFEKQKQNNHNGQNGYGHKDDYDQQLQMVLAESLTYNNGSNSNHNNSNGGDEVKLQQVSKPKECHSVVGSMENSGNINKFVSVCDKQLLPNNIDLTQYNLRCIVRHLGNNYQSGHYITDVLNVNDKKDGDGDSDGKEDKWKRHDDQYVSNITDSIATDDKAQKNAYIFFYVHQSAMKKHSVEKNKNK